MLKRTHNLLLLIGHLLLTGLLPGAFLWMLLQGPGTRQFYLAAVGAGLALLMLAWVGVLLVQRLWQRRWVEAGALALLLVVDVMALWGGVVLLGIFGISPNPS